MSSDYKKLFQYETIGRETQELQNKSVRFVKLYDINKETIPDTKLQLFKLWKRIPAMIIDKIEISIVLRKMYDNY